MKRKQILFCLALMTISLSACGKDTSKVEEPVVEAPTATPTSTPTPTPTPTPIPVKDVSFDGGGLSVKIPEYDPEPTITNGSWIFTDDSNAWTLEFTPMNWEKLDNARKNAKIDYESYTSEERVINAKTQELTCQDFAAVALQYDMNPDTENSIPDGCSHYYLFIDYGDGVIADANGMQVHLYSTEEHASIEEILNDDTVRIILENLNFDEIVTTKEISIAGVTAQYPAGWTPLVTSDMGFVVSKYGVPKTSVFLNLKKDMEPQENAGYGAEEVQEISIGDVTYYANYFEGNDGGHLELYTSFNEEYTSNISIYQYNADNTSIDSAAYWELLKEEAISTFLESIVYDASQFTDPEAELKDSTGLECNENGWIVAYNGDGGDVYVPAKIGETEIVGIDHDVFTNSNVTSVEIAEGITSFGNYCFRDCTTLKSIKLPSTISTIYEESFLGCTALEEVIISEGTTTLEAGLFYQCENLKNVTIPEGVTSIEENTFYECSSLEGITLPDSVTTVKKNAFYGAGSGNGDFICGKDTTFEELSLSKSAFKNVTFGENCNLSARAILSEAALSSVTIGEGCTEIGEAFCQNRFIQDENGEYVYDPVEFTLTLPDSIKSIGDSAFTGRNLSSLDLKQVETMGTCAFQETGIEELTIPGTLKEIPSSAFSSCKKLHEITIENGVETIGSYAFSSAGRQGNEIMKKNIYYWLPSTEEYENIESIALDPVKDGCDYPVNIHIPGSVTYVDECAFNRIIVDGMYFLDVTCADEMPEFHENGFGVSYIGQAYFEQSVIETNMEELDAFLAQFEEVGDRAYFYEGKHTMLYDKDVYEEKFGPMNE